MAVQKVHPARVAEDGAPDLYSFYKTIRLVTSNDFIRMRKNPNFPSPPEGGGPDALPAKTGTPFSMKGSPHPGRGRLCSRRNDDIRSKRTFSPIG